MATYLPSSPNQFPQQPVFAPSLPTFSRPSKRTAKSVVEKVQLDALEMAGDERLTELAIDGVARLDALRLIKARTAEANALMFELESGFAQRSARKIANRNTPLGGL